MGGLFALQTMFGQFDVNGSGSISATQCKSGACAGDLLRVPRPPRTAARLRGDRGVWLDTYLD